MIAVLTRSLDGYADIPGQSSLILRQSKIEKGLGILDERNIIIIIIIEHYYY